MPSRPGAPLVGGASYREPMTSMTDDKMLARIAALLRQAEGTDNAHEAEAFMAAAQRLATATSIDLAVASRGPSVTRTAAQEPTQRTITIGEPGSRGLRTYVQLFAVIASANDVRCDVASNSTLRLCLRLSPKTSTPPIRSTPAWWCRWCDRATPT